MSVLRGETTTAYDVCSDVLIAFDSARLRPAAKRTLKVIADELEADAGGETIRVEGHTDSRGGDDYNLDLSRRRAEAVRRFLADEGGLDAGRILIRGYGETQPAADNGKDSGRQKNRRVVLGFGSG